MLIEEFADKVVDLLKKEYPHYDVRWESVIKNNNVTLCGVLIQDPALVFIPRIYIDDYYENDWPVEDTVMSIRHTYTAHRFTHFSINTNWLNDFESVKSHFVFKVVSKDKYSELYKYKHFDVGDLSLILCILFLSPDQEDFGTLEVPLDMYKSWNADISDNELIEYVFINMQNLNGLRVIDMNSAVQEIIKSKGLDVSDELFCSDSALFIVSNNCCAHGAAFMCSKTMLNVVIDDIDPDGGYDKFYIIPSSIHEFIIVPVAPDVDISECDLQDLIINVNRTDVPVTEVLSDNLYFYTRGSDTLQNTNEGFVATLLY